jgi:hypothetical protein
LSLFWTNFYFKWYGVDIDFTIFLEAKYFWYLFTLYLSKIKHEHLIFTPEQTCYIEFKTCGRWKIIAK